MEIIINFLVDNYIYVIFVVILLILALIGYLVDSSKNRKASSLKPESLGNEKIEMEPIDTGIKLGETVNKSVSNSNADVNVTLGEKPTNSVDEVLKI